MTTVRKDSPLTAIQAQDLTLASQSYLDKHLLSIEVRIRYACEQGLRACTTESMPLFSSDTSYSYNPDRPTVMVQRVIEALQAAPRCFKAQWKHAGKQLAGGGLGDPTPVEERQEFYTWSIHISW